jgi:aspartate racemase
MKTIGLIGGLSWESSIEYYRLINEGVREKLGGLHSAQCLMYSFDFAEIEALQHQGDWDEATKRMVSAAQSLERGGADFLMICSNTMHKMAAEVQASVQIPLLHIADATAERIQAAGQNTIGLLATGFTMNQTFYTGRLTDHYGLNVLLPEPAQREQVHRIIYDELCQGVIRDESRAVYQNAIADFAERGAQAVILGCTEITLLIKPQDSILPVFDTTLIHAQAAVEYALGEHLLV